MGKKLHHYFPDNLRVISSPARRTKETLGLFFTDYDKKFSIEFDDSLYHGSPINYLEHVIKNDTDEAILFVGHNPGISECASQFSSEPIFFPTCGCAGFLINEVLIKESNLHLAEKIFYHYPKEM